MRRGHGIHKGNNQTSEEREDYTSTTELQHKSLLPAMFRKLKKYRCRRKYLFPIGFVLLLLILLYGINPNNNLYVLERNLHQSGIKNDIDINITNLHPTILWWTAYGGKTDENITCGEIKCRVSVDRTLKSHRDVKAIVFYGTSLELADMPLPRSPDIIWALKHEESPKNNDFMFSHEEILTLFNYTSTFRRQSDYPLPTQSLPNLDYLLDTTFVVDTRTKSELRRTEGLAPVLYVQSDCGAPSDRDEYVKLLQKYIPVDSYGKCLHNKDLPEHIRFDFGKSMAGMHHDDFFKLAAKYKFTLAMENAVCEDYMTEKLWRPLRLGSLPIIFGSPKVKDYLPSNKSAILVTDFKSAEHLAKFLTELDENDEKYDEYLKFKFSNSIDNQYLISHMQFREWGDFSAIQKTPKKFYSHMSGFDCFICRKIHETQEARAQNESRFLHIANIDHYGCPAPRRFDAEGKYGVYDEWFAEPWLYSKYLAKAFRKYYDRNEFNFTHNNLLALSKSLRKEDKV